MGQLQDMMMRTQGVQGRASGANTPYGPPQSPPPMQPLSNQMASYGGTSGQNYASPGGQYADQMDPEMLAMIVQMMMATQGKSPMGEPQGTPSYGADRSNFNENVQYDEHGRPYFTATAHMEGPQRWGSENGNPDVGLRPSDTVGMALDYQNSTGRSHPYINPQQGMPPQTTRPDKVRR